MMIDPAVFRKTSLLSMAGMWLTPLVAQSQPQTQENKPNIVLICTDDQGFGDVGCYGATGFSTPNLDRLASEGIRFTQFCSAQAVSSASRAALLTGTYPNRIGITGALMPWSKNGLAGTETTLAELLKPKDYATAVFGKWHLGHHREFLPLQQGFDEFTGLPYSNDMWPVDFDGKPCTDSSSVKMSYPPLPLIEGNTSIRTINTLDDQAMLTTLYTEKAVDFISRNHEKPFFLYLAHSMPHIPLAVSAKFKGKSKQGIYGDVMMEIDWSVGEIMKVLDKYGISGNTLVIFTSDNGPWLCFGDHAGSAAGLREGKGTSFEGGQRVPCIMRWPAVIPEGAICNKLAANMDIFPTIAAITSSTLPAAKTDGVNLLPLLRNDTAAEPRKALYYYYERNSLEAIRMGWFKLVFPHKHVSYEGELPRNDGYPGPTHTATAAYALYDLRRDPGERYNVLSMYPAVVDSILKLADIARNDLGDALTNNPGTHNRKPGKVNTDLSAILGTKKHLAVGATVWTEKASQKPEKDTTGILTDGQFFKVINQENDWSYWRKSQGEDLRVVVDLGKSRHITTIRTGFLHDPRSWIFRPERIVVSVSDDNIRFQEMASENAHFPSDQKIMKKDSFSFSVSVKARYIRLEARNIGVCPDWHPGKGGKAWIFSDEIIVE